MKKTSRRKQRPRNANAYGISRKIPEDIKQQVRVRSGFGCVLCREIPCDYDHFEPEFKDLKTPHSAEGIALLCARHHAEKTRGFLRAEKVKAAYLIGQANGWPPIQFLGGFQPELPISVAIANKKFTGRSSIIIHGFNILDVRYDPTAKSFLLNLTVIEKNQVIVQIVDNVLISAPQKLVDFKNTSTTFSIFTSRPKPICQLTYEPSAEENLIRFSEYSIDFLGYVASIDASGNFNDNSPLEGIVKYNPGSEVILDNMIVKITGHKRGSMSPPPGMQGKIFIKGI